VTTPASQTSYLHTGLTGGLVYSYRIKSQNEYGPANDWSDATSEQTGQAPEQPAVATLTILDVYIKISWVPPTNNYLAITSHKIIIADSTNTFIENKEVCDGASVDAMNLNFCSVPMSALWTAPFNLVYGTTIKARVIAINQRGESIASTVNTNGPIVLTVPDKMYVPQRG
jgi:hypothetical protein